MPLSELYGLWPENKPSEIHNFALELACLLKKKINSALLESKCSQSSYTYPLLLRVNISNTKIVFFQQAVIVADVIYEKLTFSFSL